MTQLDLFGEKQAAMDRRSALEADRAARAARRATYLESLKIDCCTGEPIPPNEHGCQQYRCGRCGALAFAGTFAFSHDTGWGGCPSDTEPIHRVGKTMYQAGLSAYRHDNQHYPPCARPDCGHARGVHQSVPPTPPEDARCYEYCGCRGYVAPAEPDP
ncbi:hypothetical protein AB0I51_05440 [Streptomyces sp. NPDC050549]|uniref:hypothetical protein n=1 Tax=Streptomyces sp. NPDC050549 TaxID=3155406 RepID=UPI0034387685